uniref:Uncharacterized protein n=1 Tax=Hyaloperonospora arabidopsidis (strain Emoy2) TaxID=559515 RepID=M4BPW1_HYAAE
MSFWSSPKITVDLNTSFQQKITQKSFRKNCLYCYVHTPHTPSLLTGTSRKLCPLCHSFQQLLVVLVFVFVFVLLDVAQHAKFRAVRVRVRAQKLDVIVVLLHALVEAAVTESVVQAHADTIGTWVQLRIHAVVEGTLLAERGHAKLCLADVDLEGNLLLGIGKRHGHGDCREG